MEKLIVILGLGLTIGMFNVNSADAQPASVHININLDRQPAWGPAGYDYAEFYYFPALNIYFDVNEALFYYLSGRRWVAGYYLPVAYRKYDLYYMYKVVLNDYPNPWVYNKTHKRTYVRFSNVRSQTPIRYATEHRYGKAKNNTRAWIDPRHENNRSDNRQLSNPADNRRNESQGRSSKPEVKKEQPSNRSSNSKPEVKKEQPSNR
ncbi:MAG: hypothetical protein LBT78_09665, partial [Tannerella sp.]|nr:hypothetical protein [Tannerella sp.]